MYFSYYQTNVITYLAINGFQCESILNKGQQSV